MAGKKHALLAASVAGLMAAVGVGGGVAQAAEADVPCYGINKCQGTGACGGKDHTCGGQNACAGHGFLKLPKETCLKIKDGRLTPEQQG